MNLLRRLFGRPVPAEKSLHTLVTEQVQFLLESALTRRQVAAKNSILAAFHQDPMTWFAVRDRLRGESGSHYGIAEVVATPGSSNPQWPTWLALIPTPQLTDVALAVTDISKSVTPLGGYGLGEENYRQAICEFASHVLFALLCTEEQARASASRTSC